MRLALMKRPASTLYRVPRDWQMILAVSASLLGERYDPDNLTSPVRYGLRIIPGLKTRPLEVHPTFWRRVEQLGEPQSGPRRLKQQFGKLPKIKIVDHIHGSAISSLLFQALSRNNAQVILGRCVTVLGCDLVAI